MTIEAKIVADSISPDGIRLTTFQLRYPRFIHAELMTHRVFSRNASSSRAIPVARLIEDLRRDPAMPIFWGSNQPGMQAGAELNDDDTDPQWRGLSARAGAKVLWDRAMESAIEIAEHLINLGLHKQIANRILEPWAHINVVVTATSWENFYTLRRHKDAQPEIKVLADLMWDAHQASAPQKLQPGCWHLPFLDDNDIDVALVIDGEPAYDKLIKISVARCARVSYLTHDGRQTTFEEDLTLYERLLGAQPLHASPAEHQATPDTRVICPMTNEPERYEHPELHGNLHGWIQYRKTLAGEFIPG